MKRNHGALRRAPARLLVGMLAVVGGALPAHATNSCITYQYGHVYYVAYQNSPAGAEYVVDLGDRSVFLNATDTVTFPDVSAGDFASIFSGTAPNLWVGFFGLKNPTRDGVISANGPISDFQNQSSSAIGAANQIDSWATGLAQFSNEVGSPCHANAATFPGKVFGSYQNTLNNFGQGHISGNLAWNVETRLSDSGGNRTASGTIHFNASEGNPSLGTSAWGYLGYFKVSTDGTAQYWPDRDGDGLPDVPPGSDGDADLCPGVPNAGNNTDGDADQHGAACDCNDADVTVWAVPGEVADLVFSADKHTMSWSAQTGGTTVLYDVLRGQQASPGGVPAYSCFSSNQAGLAASDPTTPAPGSLPFLYLVRAQTSCGEGTVGDGQGATRSAPSCP